MQVREWSVNIGVGIGLHARLEQSDKEGLFEGSIPNPSASETEIVAYEAEAGESLPVAFRDFLLHANGWNDFYFGLDLFGLEALRGSGKSHRARELLASYEAEEVLDEAEIEPSEVLPVAAGDGADLIVIVREGLPAAGTVVWFDGGEAGRYDDYGEFFEFTLSMLDRYVDRHEADEAIFGQVRSPGERSESSK